MNNFIKGTFRQSIYRADKGYIIGLFKVRDTNIESMRDYLNKTITFTGYFHELNENENYYFYGEEVIHPKYGFQFNVREYERVKPEDKDGIVEFLSSDLFKGVGEKLATRIVDYMGVDTLDKILKDKNSMKVVPRLSDKKIDIIYNTLTKYEESHKIIVTLTEYGFIMRDALLIYNTYKSNTMNILKNNIYQITDDISEISFVKIDAIAKNFEIDPLDINRIKACIIYVLKDLSFKNGDTYCSFSEIYNAVANYFNADIDSDLVTNALNELDSDFKIHIENDKYYLEDLYEAENNIATRIMDLVNKEIKECNITKYIKTLEDIYQIKYSEKQKFAIKKAIENNVLIITGGPGTGKTTIIKAIVEIYKMINNYDTISLCKNMALLAPTGRASKRISESTTYPATTIHRFLKWNKETNDFGVNEYNLDFSNLIIVDEASMIDTSLFDSLLSGLTQNIKLILVGDFNQLPSVGPGIVLKDLIDSDLVETVKLDLLYRQDSESYIPVLASEIKEDNLSSDFLTSKSDYQFLTCPSESINLSLINLSKKVIEKGYDYKRMQIMAPMYAGISGIDNLNKELQNVFNPYDINKKQIKYGDIYYREGDKVLQLLNVPDLNVFNGDIGIIKNINSNNELLIDFEGNLVTYKTKDLANIKHGFIISIHKSQGSEFELVILPVSKSYKRMLYRKLIYTAITRAKRKLIIVGDVDAFIYSVKNNLERKRKTDLLEKLLSLVNN